MMSTPCQMGEASRLGAVVYTLRAPELARIA